MNVQPVLDNILELVFSRHGVEDGIGMLSSLLKKYIPFEKMIWYVSDNSKQTRIPVVVVEDSAVRMGGASHRFPNPPQGWSESHYIDSDRIFVMDDHLQPLDDGSLAGMFDNRQSLIGMTLIDAPNSMISMTLTSSIAGCFNTGHLDILRLLQSSLVSLAQKYFRSSDGSPLMLASDSGPPASSQEMLRACQGLRNMVKVLEGVAPMDTTVLLLGETGVGKELCADVLHSLSDRKKNPFVRVNCAAMTETLLDDAFFGHDQGAFTGASKTYPGFFEQANTGTLFLDEVGELSQAAQARLLRVLETQDLQRVGGRRHILVDVRIVAATHRDLESMVSQGTFREDLWYRLSVFPIRIPPLRERREDIKTLARQFYTRALRHMKVKNAPILGEAYLDSLTPLPWKGNARELRNRLEQDMVLATLRHHPELTPRPDLPEKHSPALAQAAPQKALAPGNASPLGRLDELNAQHMLEALEQCRWRVNGPFGAAALLGVNPSTLRGRMKKLGISKAANKT